MAILRSSEVFPPFVVFVWGCNLPLKFSFMLFYYREPLPKWYNINKEDKNKTKEVSNINNEKKYLP